MPEEIKIGINEAAFSGVTKSFLLLLELTILKISSKSHLDFLKDLIY